MLEPISYLRGRKHSQLNAQIFYYLFVFLTYWDSNFQINIRSNKNKVVAAVRRDCRNKREVRKTPACSVLPMEAVVPAMPPVLPVT